MSGPHHSPCGKTLFYEAFQGAEIPKPVGIIRFLRQMYSERSALPVTARLFRDTRGRFVSVGLRERLPVGISIG